MLIRAVIFIILSSNVSSLEQIPQEHLRAILANKIERAINLSKHPLLIKAVKEQNAKNILLANIKEIDQAWKNTDTLTPFKKSLQTSLEGKFLKRKVINNESIYSEIFLTDNQGANVAAYPSTSDYWQGDETKWQEPFNTGKVYIGQVKFDESSNTNATQISIPIIDKDKIIGVLILGIKLSFIETNKLQNSTNDK